MRACFFANSVNDRINRLEYYIQDAEILRDFGFEVVKVANWRYLPRNVDLYYVWWWQWGFLPLLMGLGKTPCLVTGVFNYQSSYVKDYVNRPWWEKALIRATLRHATSNIFISSYEFDQISSRFAVKNPLYVPLGIDSEYYMPGLNKRERFVLMVATMDKINCVRKSVYDAVRAIPEILKVDPSVRFVLAGEVHPSSGIFELVRSLGVTDHVHFPGVVSREEKLALMQTCEVFLSPSRFEGFGLGIAEAMSCGAPVVTSRVGAVPEVVGEAGVYVNGECPSSIAKGVLRVLDSDGLRASLGTAARKRIETMYPLSRRKDGLEAVLHRLFRGTSKAIAVGK